MVWPDNRQARVSLGSSRNDCTFSPYNPTPTSIPVQGAKPIPLTSREMAETVLYQIRAEIQAGKSEWAAVAPYLPRAMFTMDKVVKRWCEELRASALPPRR